ncbi:MAG: class I SAM-dependent methyltransferase [Nitriliruptorales bacterium]|nr:class I SAM-dependent methyltransferase [Nitriliruptorales bacterium]
MDRPGERLLARLPAGPLTPAQALRLGGRLRAEHPAPLVAAAMTLHNLRWRARTKFRLADRMVFTREGLEQASSERMARHHAARFAGQSPLADLCTGIGGDLTGLAAGRPVLAADLNPVHLRMAAHNAGVYGHDGGLRFVGANVREVALDGVEAAFVDPARRQGGRRLRAGSSEPPLPWCLALAERVPAVGIKASPGLPIALVPPGWEVEFVSERRELKEALLWSPALARVTRRATLLDGGHHLDAADDPGASPPVPCAPPGRFLLDPDPAVTRAGVVEELARALGAWKIDERIAFLSADTSLDTPFGRLLRIQASLPFQLKDLRHELRRLEVGSVDIRQRGSAVDTDDLGRRLRPRGDGRATLVLTRVADRPWALVCSPAAPGNGA